RARSINGNGIASVAGIAYETPPRTRPAARPQGGMGTPLTGARGVTMKLLEPSWPRGGTNGAKGLRRAPKSAQTPPPTPLLSPLLDVTPAAAGWMFWVVRRCYARTRRRADTTASHVSAHPPVWFQKHYGTVLSTRAIDHLDLHTGSQLQFLRPHHFIKFRLL